MRIYNPALGKFLSVDPLQKEFAWNSSYAFAENDIIRCIDLDGAEKNFVYYFEFKGKQLKHVVPYSVIHPGVKEGPLGSGNYEMQQNPETKQFTGGYRKSYEDVHPIRSAAQNIDNAYKDEKGFKEKGLPTLLVVAAIVTGGASIAVEGAAAGGIMAISNIDKAVYVIDAVGIANDIDQIVSPDNNGFLPQGVATAISLITLTNSLKSLPGDALIPNEGRLIPYTPTEQKEKVIAGGVGMIVDELDAMQNVVQQVESDNESKPKAKDEK